MKRALSSILGLTFVCGVACDVPVDDTRDDSREVTPVGVIRGTMSYVGPGPCSVNGHIAGVGVILLFDANDPPPPSGTATTAVNFATVPGDVLFQNELRASGATMYCPFEHGDDAVRTVSAPFAISPVLGGRYVAQAFYSAKGTFLPEFTVRSTPQRGDVGGGYIDAVSAAAHATNPFYPPTFLPIDVGVPDPNSALAASDPKVPLIIPPAGFLRDNVPLTLGATLSTTPPYFYPNGAESGDPTVPVLTMSQDLHVLAPPTTMTVAAATAFQASFPNLVLNFGLPSTESADGTDPAQPFLLSYKATDGFHVASQGKAIPEGGLPALWPLVALTKLADVTDGTDPEALRAQGDDQLPRVVLQGITLAGGSVLLTVGDPPSTNPDPRDHAPSLTALVRPSVVCLDPRHPERGGVLTTPFFTGAPADKPNGTEVPLFDEKALVSQSNGLVREVRRGCLPVGRYAIHVVEATGQAWTTPNEAGGCGLTEGVVADPSADPSTCTSKGRAVLQSQGARAYVDIVAATTAAGQTLCSTTAPVPPECLQNPSSGDGGAP